MMLAEAKRVLGVIGDEFTESDVKSAFNRAVRLSHPDTGGGLGNAAQNIERAKKARDLLLRRVGTADLNDGTCDTCKGTGSVRARTNMFVTITCKPCKGSGKDANFSRRR